MTTNNKQHRKVGASPGGSILYEYNDLTNTDWRPPKNAAYAEDVEKHFQKLYPNRQSSVLHEITSDLVHINVHIMKPTTEKPFYVAYTTGMSDLPMTLPEDITQEYKHLERAELFIMLPESWNPGEDYSISNNIPYEQYWPIHILKSMARFPHEYGVWLGWGHTVPNGPNYEPILDDCGMGGFVLLELDEDFSPLYAADGTPVHLYMIAPVYREEIEYKLEHGMNALEELLIQNNLPLVVDLYRKNYCK